jgi:hypothetical protein
MLTSPIILKTYYNLAHLNEKLKNSQNPKNKLDEQIRKIMDNPSRCKMVVDVHLLAFAQLAGLLLWTADKRLKSVADQLELTFK